MARGPLRRCDSPCLLPRALVPALFAERLNKAMRVRNFPKVVYVCHTLTS